MALVYEYIHLSKKTPNDDTFNDSIASENSVTLTDKEKKVFMVTLLKLLQVM